MPTAFRQNEHAVQRRQRAPLASSAGVAPVVYNADHEISAGRAVKCIMVKALTQLIAAHALWMVAQASAFGQVPAIYLSGQINTQLPTTSFGGGGPYFLPFGSNNPILQNSAALPPYSYADSVIAFDPNSNGLYSASAASSVNVLSVYNGTLSVAAQTSGGSLDPDASAGGEAVGNVEWQDQIIVGGLAHGKPVILQVTDEIHGKLNLEPSNPEGASRLYHGIQISNSEAVLSPNTNYTKSGIINSSRKYRFKTYSGAILNLTNVIYDDLNGGGQWNYSASVEVARIYIDSLTLGAQVTSASGLNYATPSNLLSVPSVVSQTESAAVDTLTAIGLTTGNIANQSSSTVPAGEVISQLPEANTDVEPLFPVNLIVSSGLATKPCAGDASSLVSVAQSGYTYNKATQLYEQTVTVMNTSATAIKGPISVLIENLSTGVTVHNPTGSTSCDYPGTPYVSKGGSLAAGQSDQFVLHFADPTQATFSWTAGITAQGSP